jgi:hypothetical protein
MTPTSIEPQQQDAPPAESPQPGSAEPQQREAPRRERPEAGSLLFPDLVWAHYAWQSRARPHRFRTVKVVTKNRRQRILFWTRRDRAPSSPNGAAPTPVDAGRSVNDLKQDCDIALASFKDAEGEIVRAYWCSSEASAVVLTEKKEKKRFNWLPWRRVGNFELHRATDWVTDEAPRIAELLHSGDTLTIRINRVLNAIPRRIAMEWVFSEQSYLLGFVERTGRHPSPEELDSAVRRHQDEIERLERYYGRAANKAARIWYFGGMLCGLVGVIALGALIPFVLTPFGEIDLASTSMRRFYACFVAGAIGAMVSVMTRMRDEDRISLDYEVGELLIVLLGSFRPLLGAIFGVVAYFAIEGGVIGLTAPTGHPAFFYYALFAFLAGFSERFAHVILGKADLAVESGSASEAPPQAPPTAAATPRVTSPAQAPGAPSNGRTIPGAVSGRRTKGPK